jgi:hypothetical protein
VSFHEVGAAGLSHQNGGRERHHPTVRVSDRSDQQAFRPLEFDAIQELMTCRGLSSEKVPLIGNRARR